MLRPRHIVIWGERLRMKRTQNYLKSLPDFHKMSLEEKCAYHLAQVGEVKPYNVEASTAFWHDTLDEECEDCPHMLSCKIYLDLGEE